MPCGHLSPLSGSLWPMRNDGRNKPIPAVTASCAPEAGLDFGQDGWAAAPPTRVHGLERLAWTGIALAALAVLALAAWLQPAGEGLGTHQQLGLPACGWITAANMPCPTCGMTTAFSHAADGNLLASIRAQPMGALLALGTAIVVIVGGWTALAGSTLAPFLTRLFNARVGWVLLGLFIAAWIFKIMDHKEWL